jgi:UDP-galactopyranose mutase
MESCIKKYQLLAAKLKNVHFAGRLGTYKYYNMDQVVAQALTLFKKLLSPSSTDLYAGDEKLNGIMGRH